MALFVALPLSHLLLGSTLRKSSLASTTVICSPGQKPMAHLRLENLTTK